MKADTGIVTSKILEFGDPIVRSKAEIGELRSKLEDLDEEARHRFESIGSYQILELSHDWNVFYDQILHQRAITRIL